MMPRDVRQRKLKAGRLNLNSWENTATLSKLYSIFLDTLIRVEYISRVPMSHFAWGQAIKEMEKTTQGEFHTKKVPWNQRSKHLDWILLGACFSESRKEKLGAEKSSLHPVRVYRVLHIKTDYFKELNFEISCNFSNTFWFCHDGVKNDLFQHHNILLL